MTEYNLDQAMDGISSDGDGVANTPSPAESINQPAFDPNLVVPYKANGKEISEPLSTVIQRASMGYNYAQLMQQYKQQQAELEAQRNEINQSAQKWRQYDEYASQNPDWANHVRSQWENRLNFGNQSNPTQTNEQPFEQQQREMNLPPQVAQELNELRTFMQQYKQDREAQHQAEQDAQLAQEVDSVQKAYPDFDLRATDPQTGESLEQQILMHAQTYGIGSFRAAFRDFMYDKLVARGTNQAKETVAKQMQQQYKQGIVGQSNTPMTPSYSRPQGRLNYEQAMELAAKEFGIE